MGSRSIFYMTFAVIVGIVVILAMNIAKTFGGFTFSSNYFTSNYLLPNDVRGMAIEHNKLLYTLNFDQQNAVVEILNQSIPIPSEISPNEQSSLKPAFEKLVIYRFHAPDIEILPVGYVKKMTTNDSGGSSQQDFLAFSAPIWNRTGLMQETTAGFKNLISQTYDP